MNAQFFVQGIPKAQPRPRAYAMKMGNKFTARMYDPGTTDGWKQLIKLASLPYRRSELCTGPVMVTLTFLIDRPKSHFLKSGLRSTAPRHHLSKPDVDNLAKAVLDGLTDSQCFWVDDSQIYSLLITKRYIGANESAGVEIHACDDLI